MTKSIKNFLNQEYNNFFSDRLWFRIQYTIQVQKRSFFYFLSFYKLVYLIAVFLIVGVPIFLLL